MITSKWPECFLGGVSPEPCLLMVFGCVWMSALSKGYKKRGKTLGLPSWSRFCL